MLIVLTPLGTSHPTSPKRQPKIHRNRRAYDPFQLKDWNPTQILRVFVVFFSIWKGEQVRFMWFPVDWLVCYVSCHVWSVFFATWKIWSLAIYADGLKECPQKKQDWRVPMMPWVFPNLRLTQGIDCDWKQESKETLSGSIDTSHKILKIMFGVSWRNSVRQGEVPKIRESQESSCWRELFQPWKICQEMMEKRIY